MSILQTSSLTEITNKDTVISEKLLSYFRERQKNRLYDFVINSFLKRVEEEAFSKAKLARKLKKEPAQITRWLSSPGNWTLDTLSDLMLAINGSEVQFTEIPLISHTARNFTQMDYVNSFTFDRYSATTGTTASTALSTISL